MEAIIIPPGEKTYNKCGECAYGWTNPSGELKCSIDTNGETSINCRSFCPPANKCGICGTPVANPTIVVLDTSTRKAVLACPDCYYQLTQIPCLYCRNSPHCYKTDSNFRPDIPLTTTFQKQQGNMTFSGTAENPEREKVCCKETNCACWQPAGFCAKGSEYQAHISCADIDTSNFEMFDLSKKT